MIKQDNQSDLSDKIRFISHEIRNNLSICDMYSRIIKVKLEKDNIKNPSIDNALECIHDALLIIGMNLNDLKSLNVNSKKLYEFKTLATKGFEMGKAYAKEEDKDINFELSINNSANICVDECRFLSCIVNIIKNATEAIENKGNIKVFGRVENANCILEISNDGKPISVDNQKHLFDCGFTTKKSGSGFGLNICKKYLQEQNASLELEKSNSKETVFKITIPVA